MNRVRPNSEVSAWMYDEIGQLEEEIERLDKTIVTLLADNDSLRTTVDKLRGAIERVRALHASVEIGFGPICDECSSASDGWIVPYPCPTLRALDGEDA